LHLGRSTRRAAVVNAATLAPALAAHRRTKMKYALTLSRWHKVAERINSALKEREANVKKAFTGTTISPWNKEGIEEKAAAIARRAAEDLALIEKGTVAVAQIRAALAIRNAELE
jgi:hypothetical protein